MQNDDSKAARLLSRALPPLAKIEASEGVTAAILTVTACLTASAKLVTS
jgi:hypothetical protein